MSRQVPTSGPIPTDTVGAIKADHEGAPQGTHQRLADVVNDTPVALTGMQRLSQELTGEPIPPGLIKPFRPNQ